MANGFTDPRELGGDIAGPGGPHDRNAVVVNTERALLPDTLTVACFEQPLRPGLTQPLLAMVIEGRVNQTRDRARLMFILDPDAAAAIVTEIIGAASRDLEGRRSTGDVADGFGAQFRVALDERREALRDV